ncbi:MAG: signal peptidase II [Rhodospirillales bacterium]|nr:signal peptidase II [Rhodospirillales bacterium]
MTRHARYGLVLALVIVVLDLASKAWMMAFLGANGRWVEVLPFFKLAEVWNRGMSFGLFSDSGAKWVLIALALAISAGITWWLRAANGWRQGMALGLVLGGAVGNVIDRLRFGAVYDFLYFHLGDWYWPAFNLADSAITVGVVLLVWDSLFEQGESPKKTLKAR